MDTRLNEWKLAVDRLWADAVIDHCEALQLASDMARQGRDTLLREAAAQSLPSLRAACAKGADRRTKDTAQRRFGAVRDRLYALTRPRFGKRESAEDLANPDNHYRRLLGLPRNRRLFGPEIQHAYKLAAKKMHPDAGGNERDFLELTAARDALMKSK